MYRWFANRPLFQLFNFAPASGWSFLFSRLTSRSRDHAEEFERSFPGIAELMNLSGHDQHETTGAHGPGAVFTHGFAFPLEHIDLVFPIMLMLWSIAAGLDFKKTHPESGCRGILADQPTDRDISGFRMVHFLSWYIDMGFHNHVCRLQVIRFYLIRGRQASMRLVGHGIWCIIGVKRMP